MPKYFLFLLSLFSLTSVAQDSYFVNDSLLEYRHLRDSVSITITDTSDLKKYKIAEELYYAEYFNNSIKVLESIKNSYPEVFLLLRNNHLSLEQFNQAFYYHGKLDKTYRKKNELRRNILSNISISPQFTTTDNFTLALPSPSIGLSLNLRPTSNLLIEQQIIGIEGDNSHFYYSHGTYNLRSNFQINHNYSVQFNYLGSQLQGDRLFYHQTEIQKDSVNQSGSTVDYTFRDVKESGFIKQGINQVNLGIKRTTPRLTLGLNFATHNAHLIDNLITTSTDSVIRHTYLNNGDTIKAPLEGNETIYDLSEIERSTQQQISLYAKYTPSFFKNGFNCETWIDIPFSSSDSGVSNYVKTSFRLTQNTWISGWVRTYYGLTPVELGATTLNAGIDNVKLKYGGEVKFHPSKRWWTIFNIEYQKRKEYHTKSTYNTLSLNFKFLYRLYR